MNKKRISLMSLARLLLGVGLFAPLLAQAYTGITVVVTASTPTNLEFVESLKDELAATKNNHLKVKIVELKDSDKLVVAENSELVIALGVKALEESSKLQYTTPVLGVFTPLPAFNSLLVKGKRELGNFSAIVLDQPYWRQISLIKTVLPNTKKLGILLGSTSTQYTDYLTDEAEKAGLSLNIEAVKTSIDIIPKLNKVLDANDVLLAIPDPQIYNRETAEPILLTSYRHQKPVFGYSQSYVRAGALAAVFSSTKQLAKQAAEISTLAQQSPNLLPPPQVPKYFSISVNRQVARSLNIGLMDDDVLYNKMMQLETTERDEREPHNR